MFCTATNRKLPVKEAPVDLTADPGVCACGKKKPYTEEIADKCTGCRRYVCTFKECKYTGPTDNDVRKHNTQAHKNRIFKATRKQTVHCVCGRFKDRSMYRPYYKCDSCTLVWCNREKCKMEFINVNTYKDHCETQHKADLALDVTRCGHCLFDYKPRGEKDKDSDVCPRCSIIWCLITPDCAFEGESNRSLAAHVAQKHKKP